MKAKTKAKKTIKKVASKLQKASKAHAGQAKALSKLIDFFGDESAYENEHIKDLFLEHVPISGISRPQSIAGDRLKLPHSPATSQKNSAASLNYLDYPEIFTTTSFKKYEGQGFTQENFLLKGM